VPNRALAFLAATVLLAACGGRGGDEPPADAVVRLPAEDRALPPPAPVYAIGAEDGAEWESFAHLGHLAFDADDNLYILDRGAGKVFVFDSTGRHIRSFARSGQGPGELAFPLQLAVTREGTVVVSDLRKRAFSLFGRDGAYRDELPFEYTRGVGGMEVRPHPGGGFVTVYQPAPGMQPDTGHLRLVWQSENIDRKPQVLAAIRSDPRRLGAGVAAPNQPAFSHGFYWGVLPTGEVAVTHTAGYRIDVFGGDGKPRLTLERPIDPRPTTDADRQAERDRRMAHMIEAAGSVSPAVRQAAQQEMEKLTFAETMPVIQEFAVDAFGRMWVRRGTTPGGTDGRIDVIAADGRYLGTFPGARVPQAFSPSGLAAFVEEDEMEVPHVVVRRAPRTWGAAAAR
jgi:hypothetical protein